MDSAAALWGAGCTQEHFGRLQCFRDILAPRRQSDTSGFLMSLGVNWATCTTHTTMVPQGYLGPLRYLGVIKGQSGALRSLGATPRSNGDLKPFLATQAPWDYSWSHWHLRVTWGTWSTWRHLCTSGSFELFLVPLILPWLTLNMKT
jgi:hypothetical protein